MQAVARPGPRYGPLKEKPEDRELFIRSLRTLMGRWKIEILWTLAPGTLRFGELRHALPDITQHMLTSALRELEADGLVRRVAYAEVPPRVEYTVTEAALALKPVFMAVMDWAQQHAPPIAGRDALPEGGSRE